MENAAQALIIAAGVLVGVLILSLGIYLATTLAGYSANTQSEIDKNVLAQFNDEFLKYSGRTDLSIQDIITVKNYALENNNENGNYNPTSSACRAGENNDYIDVFYHENKSMAKSENISVLILDDEDEFLLKNEMEKQKNDSSIDSNRFTCEVIVNSTTGKVNKVYFYAN